ncbi:putative ankyrin repeat protein RF_0381 [Belonocnema kinseyi]|uniref:putative ankyrin repeat protein RF_0381 n=1 Tax=Belonocnema kinseyi TaxID=2817044 RepID=UPI00143D3ADD|nr:putative ankyrin repeat protein RF_0381 [Belonocnema kinseyi]
MEILKKSQSESHDSYTRQRLSLLDFGVNINIQDRRGQTQLHKELSAAIFRSGKSKHAFKTTQLLIEHGADINICSKDGTSPLQEAFLSGNLDAVEAFLPEEDRLLKSNQVDSIKRCRYLIKFFLDQGKDLNIVNSNYSTLLHFAAWHGDNEGFDLILNNSKFNLNAFNSKGTTLLHVVTIHGTCEMIKSLIDHGADSNLRIQIDQGQQNSIDKITGFTPLHLAVSKGKFEIVETLVKKGADVNATSPHGSPLHVACDTFYSSKSNDKSHHVHKTKIVKFLIQQGANIHALNSTKKTPLLTAVDNKYEKMVEVLLQEGANFQMKFHQKRNTLHYIVGINHLGIMKLFLDKGLDPNVRDCRNETPLIYGAKSSAKGISMDVAELLVEYGADIDAADNNGNTALHVASGLNDVEVIKRLLKLKANVNARTKNELTALDRVLIKYRGSKINRKITAVECLCAHTALSISKGAKDVSMNMIETQPLVHEYYKKCEKELDLMQKERICGSSSICYFDLLKVDAQKLTLFVRNEDVMDVIASGEYKEKFPVYASLLKDCVEEGKTRRDLIERDSLLLKKLIKRQLPYFVNDMIFNSLSLKDLKNFEKAFYVQYLKFTVNTMNLRIKPNCN